MPTGIAQRAAPIPSDSDEGARLRRAYEAQGQDPNRMQMLFRRMNEGIRRQREGDVPLGALSGLMSNLKAAGDAAAAARDDEVSNEAARKHKRKGIEDLWRRIGHPERTRHPAGAEAVRSKLEEIAIPLRAKGRMRYPLRNPVRHRDEQGRKIEPGPAYMPQDILSEVG